MFKIFDKNVIDEDIIMRGRLGRLKVFFHCLAHIFFHGLNFKRPVEVKSLIIIQLAKLGDMVCTTPMFRAVKDKYPNTRLVVMGNGINGELLKYNRDVDEYLIWDSKNIFANVDLIKKQHCDFGCVTGPNFEGLATLILSGVRFISAPKVENGWSPYETKLYRFLRNFVIAVPHRMGFYAPREYLRLLESIGIQTDDVKKHLGFSEMADKVAKQFFIDNNIDPEKDFVVGVSPTAGNKIKEWPAERFAQVADYLCNKHNAKVVIIGGKGDIGKAQELIGHLGKRTAFANATGIFGLDELKAFMSKLHMFVSVDTGPIYIAEAFDIPTIDITGPIDEKEQPPQGSLHRNVVPSERLRPELFVLNARSYDKEEAIRQLQSITVGAVENEIDLLITEMGEQLLRAK